MTVESRPETPRYLTEILNEINKTGVPDECPTSRLVVDRLEELRDSFEANGCDFLYIILYINPDQQKAKLYLRYEDEGRLDDGDLEESGEDLVKAQITRPGVKNSNENPADQIILGAQVARAMKLPFRIETPDHLLLDCSIKDFQIKVEKVTKLRTVFLKN